MERFVTRLIRPLSSITLTGALALTVAFGAAGRAEEVLLGPAEELSVLDDFTADTQSAWQTSVKAQGGVTVPGVAASVMKVEFPAGTKSYGMNRSFAAGTIGKDAEGVRILISSAEAGQRWMRLTLQVGGVGYSYDTSPHFPARLMTEFAVPFESFVSAEKKSLPADKAAEVDKFGIEFTTNGLSGVYFDRLTTFRHKRYSAWLSVKSTRPTNNMFEPGEKVSITLTPGGTVPVAAKALRYEVRDFYEKAVAGGTVKLDGSAAYPLDLTPKTHGYYELRAWWLDEAGKDLEEHSCIRAEGTQPPGVTTFAVMPHTVAQNVERFKGWGDKAFFGLHGDFLGIADLIGLTWRFGYTPWQDLEPTKPDRSKGMAPWAAERIAKEEAQPSYRVHIHAATGNYGNVAWAKQEGDKSLLNWNAYLPFVKDQVAAEKHLYPHQKPRIYGVGWEINLFMPPYNFKPVHTPADVFEMHRQVYGAIKSVDPDSIVMGPCSSNLSKDFFEPIFKTGLLKYVDAIETHGYPEPLFNPEDNDYAGKLSTLRTLMAQYNDGKVLPIYVTEAGIRGMIGSKITQREQGQLLTRLAIILKGEGVKVFLPFYGIDYDRDGWWGICFNLEVDGKPSPWHTGRISPKPAVNAIATCVDMLEGTTPAAGGRLKGLGDEVWAYQFDRQGTPVVAIWTVGVAKSVSLPAGKLASVEVVDIMGRRSQVPAKDGHVELAIDGSPQYLVGLVPAPAAAAR